MTEATVNPLSGLWKPNHLDQLWYGPDSVRKHLLDSLPKSSSRAYIITGSSLANKTSLVRQVEQLLGPERHAGTFADIKQHAPVAQLDEAAELLAGQSGLDTIISVGGGSPIDSAKAISLRFKERTGEYLYHVSIPTTLSAAECTFFAGYTDKNGKKQLQSAPELLPSVIIYDAKFALDTPPWLWTSTGMRAVDHAVELMYHPTATEMPTRYIALSALSTLFIFLPKYKEDPKNEDHITNLQLASFASLGFMGRNIKGGIGLSHSLGYALGSPYSIPHGITSCLTLGGVCKLKADDAASAAQLARILPFIGQTRTGNDREDAITVGNEINRLVQNLGLSKKLKEYDVGEDQVPVIAKSATGSESGELYDKVAELVKGLY